MRTAVKLYQSEPLLMRSNTLAAIGCTEMMHKVYKLTVSWLAHDGEARHDEPMSVIINIHRRIERGVETGALFEIVNAQSLVCSQLGYQLHGYMDT